MALESLRQNIETEKKLIREIISFKSKLESLEGFSAYESKERDMRIIQENINSMLSQMKLLNDSLPEILHAVSAFRKLDEKEGKEDSVKSLVKVNYHTPSGKEGVSVTLKSSDREKFLKELSLNMDTIKRLKKNVRDEDGKNSAMEFKKGGFYSKISNKIFFNLSESWRKKEFFARLNTHLRKANLPFLLTTYISVSLMTTLLLFLVSIFIFVFMMFYDLKLSPPFLAETSRSVLSTMKYSPLIFVAPVLTFLSFYFYPTAESKSIESKINQELPFLTIHMSAIAGSSIEPSQIFVILASSREYPSIRTELKKIINQVNVYGYDLVTALKNTGRTTSSKKLAELINGMASIISKGGSLKDFLDKRAESLIFEYKLEREKHTKSAETFMNVYISIMIAAPMIMTLLIILMSVSGMGIGLGMNALTLIIISIVSLINMVFLVFLHLNQPEY